MSTPTKNILIRLPVEIAHRLDALVPRRKRNQFIVKRVAEVIDEHDAELSRIAILVTKDEHSQKELRHMLDDWDRVAGDGISSHKEAYASA